MADDISSEVQAEESLPQVPVQEAPETSTPEVASPESASPFGAFRSMPGMESATDEEIVQRLQETVTREQQAYRALQQYQQIIPAASDYLSNRTLFEQWKNSRNQPSAPAAPSPAQEAPESWWNPPKVRDAYKSYLVRDEQGREVISENAPLEARHAIAEYQAYRAEFAKNFLEDPQKALGPMIEKIVSDRAREISETQISSMKEENYVSQVEAENKDWLYDPNGNVSREGFLVQKYIEDARGYGINGAKARWDYATAMVERDLAIANLQRQPQSPPQPVVPQQAPAPQVTAAQKNMDFLRQQATRTAPRRAQSSTDPRTPQKPATFAEKMLVNLQKAGIQE